MKTLVGSTALSQYIPINRNIKDTDYFSDKKIKGSDCFYHPDLEKWDWGNVATLDELYTIKLSHSYWELPNNSWEKHIHDLMIMKKNNAQLILELHDILYPIWEEKYGKKQVNLNMEPEEFFNTNIKRKYEHDSVHAAIAYGDNPLFNKILRDDHKVAVSQEKFNNLDYDMQCKLVREEVYATACERIIIPALDMTPAERMAYGFSLNQNKAYHTMLKKTITSLSKGWFPRFILDNISDLINPDVDYVKRLKNNTNKLVLLDQLV